METTSAIVCDPAIVIAEDRTMLYLKAGFHMIADRRSQIADRKQSQLIADDRVHVLKARSFHMIADDRRSQTIADLIAICDLRSAIIWKPAFR